MPECRSAVFGKDVGNLERVSEFMAVLFITVFLMYIVVICFYIFVFLWTIVWEYFSARKKKNEVPV